MKKRTIKPEKQKDHPQQAKPHLILPAPAREEKYVPHEADWNYAPQSELEAKLLDKLQWNTYQFNFPPVKLKRRKTSVVKILDTKLQKITWVKHPVVLSTNIWSFLPGTEKWRRTHSNYFGKYLKNLHFPPDFEEKMPYMYAILRDIFYTNLVNKENIQKIQRGWDYMAQQFAELVTTFWTFYRHVKHYKVLIRHFRRYPQYLIMITEFERLIASFTDPTDLHRKTTPPPRPKNGK